jgi:hypothetical protein
VDGAMTLKRDQNYPDVTVTTNTNAETTYMDFVGSFSPVSFTANDRTRLFLGAANSLYYPNEAMDVGSCRAYFQLKGGLTAGCLTAGENASGVRAFNLNFGGDDATV